MCLLELRGGCVSVYCQPSSSLPAGGPVKSEVGYSIMGSVGNPCDPSLAPPPVINFDPSSLVVNST